MKEGAQNYEEKIDLGNGYTKYLYCLSAMKGVNVEGLVIQPMGEMGSNDVMQFILTDIRAYTYEETEDAGWNQNTVRALRVGADADTLIFTNLEAGVQEQFNNNVGLDYSYTTDVKYGSE